VENKKSKDCNLRSIKMYIITRSFYLHIFNLVALLKVIGDIYMDYVSMDEEYKNKISQVPKIFLINDKYNNMSINEKFEWTLLYERCSLSRRNRWYDKETNRFYFIYINSELMKIMNIKSKSTLSKVKKELEDLNLLESKRLGLNKPNKLYLGYPEFNESDLYAFEKQEETNTKTLADKGSPFSGRPENGLQDVQKVNTNNTNYNNPELEDIDTVDTSENIKKQLIEKAFYGNYGKIPKNLSNA